MGKGLGVGKHRVCVQGHGLREAGPKAWRVVVSISCHSQGAQSVSPPGETCRAERPTALPEFLA